MSISGFNTIPLFEFKKLGFLLIPSFIFLSACQKNSESSSQSDLDALVELSIPYFPEMPVPLDKPITEKRIALGQKLFFDPILSRNNDISCATCHLPEYAFTDALDFSIGTEGRRTERNAPTLFNLAWHPYFFMDGGNPELESQILGPIENPNEMDLPFTEAMARVANHPEYPDLFEEAFGDGVSPITLSTAIATYERVLVSYNSPFDQYYYQSNKSALSEAAKRGLDLFLSNELNCSSCHALPLTTNFNFENNGLYTFYQDAGRVRITEIAQDSGKFKVPTLRNIELTAPYMHDGGLKSLEEVIDHYASGGKNHVNKSPLLTGFQISESQKMDLILFLKSLTDTVSYKIYLP